MHSLLKKASRKCRSPNTSSKVPHTGGKRGTLRYWQHHRRGGSTKTLLQHTATHTLQHTATHTATRAATQVAKKSRSGIGSVEGYDLTVILQQVRCSVLQCVAVCCRASIEATISASFFNSCATTGVLTHCNTLQHTATHCNTPHHTATHGNTRQHTAPHRTTPHHTATHRTTPHHTAPHRNTPHHTATAARPQICQARRRPPRIRAQELCTRRMRASAQGQTAQTARTRRWRAAPRATAPLDSYPNAR